MHREGPLKNIFKEENWEELNKASSHMYTRKGDEEFDPEEYEKSKHNPKEEKNPDSANENTPESHSHLNKEEIEKAFSKLKEEKDSEIKELIHKINEMITRQNRLESALEEKENKIKELYQKFELFHKRPEPVAASPSEEKKEALDKPIDRNNVAPSDVSIQKMFNFSNKKF